MSAVSEKLGARTREIHERAAAVEQVKTCTRDLWEVLERRVHRLDQPAEVLQFCQLPLSGDVSNPTTQEEWLALAAQVVQGGADATAADHPAMVNPSAAQLQAVLAATRPAPRKWRWPTGLTTRPRRRWRRCAHGRTN